MNCMLNFAEFEIVLISRIIEEFEKRGLKSSLLQVHDSYIFEIESGEIVEVNEILVSCGFNAGMTEVSK